MPSSIYDQNLAKNSANYAPLSPLSFLQRSADVYPHKTSIIYGTQRFTWSETYARCKQLASSLSQAGIGKNDTVAVILPNTPPMVEAHFGIAMCGGVLNTLNTRLDAASIAFMLDFGEAKALILDPEYLDLISEVLKLRKSKNPLLLITTEDYHFPNSKILGDLTYEQFLAQGDKNYAWQLPQDEWDAIALNYTSGTTGNPKGVVYHHRGAAINAVSNILEWDMPKHPVYLWTLPMFHCNGWCFPWAIAARAGINVCIRKIDAELIFAQIKEHQVTHYCSAPIVHSILINAPDHLKQDLPPVNALVAGAAPSTTMIAGLEQMGFDLTHVYGLTEIYGPATVCAKHEHWQDLSIGERARLNARQGVRYHLQNDTQVLDPETMEPVPMDGETMGEIMTQGNITMKGYLKNQDATEASFKGGWFHTGDLAVQYPDGYIQIKDRSKDIIISGGESISSLEIEEALYKHPAVMTAAVVARPDDKWGETPCAFLELKPNTAVSAVEIVAHCRANLAHYKVPRYISFSEIPKTSTGKIQKFELRKIASNVPKTPKN